MNRRLFCEGIEIKIKPADLNKDGKTGGVEDIEQKLGQNLTVQSQPAEMKDIFEELNKDAIDPLTNMSSIDTRAIIHSADVQSLAAWDSLVWLGFLPKDALNVSRKLLRLSKSQDGKGITSMENVAIGSRAYNQEQERGKVARFFLGKKKEEEVGVKKG